MGIAIGDLDTLMPHTVSNRHSGLGELRRIEAGGDVGDELLATIDLISVTLGGMKED